jgi:hypothetical protein
MDGESAFAEWQKAILKMTNSLPEGAQVAFTPRSHGESRLAGKKFAEFLKTPGYNTDDVERFGGHDEYMKHLLKTRKEEKEIADMSSIIKQNNIYIGDLDDLSTEEALVALVTNITAHFRNKPQTFMLNAPAQLTCKKSNGGFTKKAHIGGEEFSPVSAYVGKRQNIIFILKPDFPAEYEHIELGDREAINMLTNFNPYLNEAMTNGGRFDASLKKIKKMESNNKESKSLEGKSEQYADIGFGTW